MSRARDRTMRDRRADVFQLPQDLDLCGSNEIQHNIMAKMILGI